MSFFPGADDGGVSHLASFSFHPRASHYRAGTRDIVAAGDVFMR